jgi:hypothetical protein
LEGFACLPAKPKASEHFSNREDHLKHCLLLHRSCPGGVVRQCPSTKAGFCRALGAASAAVGRPPGRRRWEAVHFSLALANAAQCVLHGRCCPLAAARGAYTFRRQFRPPSDGGSAHRLAFGLATGPDGTQSRQRRSYAPRRPTYHPPSGRRGSRAQLCGGGQFAIPLEHLADCRCIGFGHNVQVKRMATRAVTRSQANPQPGSMSLPVKPLDCRPALTTPSLTPGRRSKPRSRSTPSAISRIAS